MAKTKVTNKELPSAFSLFKPSYEALMVNIWTFLGLLGIPFGAFILASLIGGSYGAVESEVSIHPVAALLLLAVGVFVLLAAPAFPYVQLKSVRHEVVTIGEAFQAGMRFFWRYWGVTLLSGLLIVGGFVLLIVPGLFMLRRYILAPFYLYDHNFGVMEAMRHSAADSKVFSSAIWGLIGVTILIGLPSIVPLFFLITAVLQVVYYCAPAVRYQEIKAAKK